MHAAFWLLVAAGAASGKLIDDLQGQWAVTEIDVGAMAKEMRNTDDIRPEDDIEFTRGGFVDLNGTSLEKTGRATIGKVGSFQELNVVVESAKKSKVATITFLEPGEDDNIDADSAALPYLTLKAKTEPFNNGKLSTRRYASRVYGEGQAQVFFHNDKSFYVALHPDAGGSVATRSLWFARGDEEPSAWDQWPMYVSGLVALAMAKFFTSKVLGGGNVQKWKAEKAAEQKKKDKRAGAAKALSSPLKRRRK